jgi:hypothetical protein
MQIDLQLKKEYLTDILSGKKIEEFRECTDANIKKFCELDGEGNAASIKPITQIRFFNGYATDRPMAIVEVKGLTLDPYEGVDVDKAEEEDTVFVFKLGRVIERQNC